MKKDNRQRLFEVMGKVNSDFDMAATMKRIKDKEKSDEIRNKQDILYNKSTDFSASGINNNPKQYVVTPESHQDSNKDIKGNDMNSGYSGEENDLTHERLSGTYLHGKADDKSQQYGGWDIFSFRGEAPDRNGIYKVIIEYPDGNVQGTLFLWNREEVDYGDNYKGKRYNGLVVMNDDTDAFNHAMKAFNSRRPSI